MNRLRTTSKFLVALLTAVVIAAQAPATDGQITSGEWLAIGIAVIGSALVWAVPNQQKGRHEPRVDTSRTKYPD